MHAKKERVHSCEDMTEGERREKRHEIAANLNFALFEIPRSPRLQPLFAKTRPRAERYSKIRIAMRCGIHQRKYTRVFHVRLPTRARISRNNQPRNNKLDCLSSDSSIPEKALTLRQALRLCNNYKYNSI